MELQMPWIGRWTYRSPGKCAIGIFSSHAQFLDSNFTTRTQGAWVSDEILPNGAVVLNHTGAGVEGKWMLLHPFIESSSLYDYYYII